LSLAAARELADRILTHLPCDEETLALRLGTSRSLVASICFTLHRQRKIKKDQTWDTPRHWTL
jgi:hypothetical protein